MDCGERHYGNKKFMANLAACMEAEGCNAIAGIIITHLHHDHYGGVDNLQEVYGPGIPIYKAAVDYSNHWVTLEALKKKKLLHVFLEAPTYP